ncbi:hypothetical protein PRK78_005884 [Emydomyces testavorans]|uniref:Subtilisin-like protease n=1 Tax=Emydomyces testavorans TaxID=2070801 RepID=A0AAF0DKF2_9EURO|nr:hypothetical protein PRK78_005884 [Emydomyces testavorans]
MGFFFKLAIAAVAVLSVVRAGEFIPPNDTKGVTKDGYIVVMKKGTSDRDFDTHRTWAAKIQSSTNKIRSGKQFSGPQNITFHIGSLMGYSGVFDLEVAKKIAESRDVLYVQPNHRLSHPYIQKRRPRDQDTGKPISRTLRQAPTPDSWAVQPFAPSWGLRRISHRQSGSKELIYQKSAGEGIMIYHFDTGVDISHPEFENRATWGFNSVDDKNYDNDGHGTHVAGTVIGKTLGIAKKAKLVAIRITGRITIIDNSTLPIDVNWKPSGDKDEDDFYIESSFFQALTWALQHARQHQTLEKAIMLIEVQGPKSRVLDQAISEMAGAGFFVVIPAGNVPDADASTFSPQGADGACLIGASASNDTAASWSSLGPKVDLYAPGVDIPSARAGGGTTFMSGTSFAAPHAAGVAACLMSAEKIAPLKVCDRLKELALPSIKNPPPNTTNKLLYNGSGA